MTEPVPENNVGDIITFSLYSRISDDNTTSSGYKRYEAFLEKEIVNINNVLEKTDEAAKIYERTPPQVKLKFCLIHADGKEINPGYLNECKVYFRKAFTENIKSEYETNFSYVDFEPNDKKETDFLKELKAAGSYIDINKCRLIIENAGRRHLQMDTNTFVPCWRKLYENTFLKDKDSYGCSRCSLYYIAVHNKIVYLSENSELPKILETELEEFYTKNKDNEDLKHKDINIIYDVVWGGSLFKLGAAHKLTIADRVNTSKNFSFYPASVNNSLFTLNEHYLQAHHQTWNPNKAELDLIDKDFVINLDGLEGVELDPGFKIDKAAIETIFTTYSNVPVIDNYKTYRSSVIHYDDAGYTDFYLFLNKLNLDLDEYIINKIVGGYFLEKLYPSKAPPEAAETLVRTASRGAAPKKDFDEKIKDDLDILKKELVKLMPEIKPKALENFCKIKIYLGYTVEPSINLICTSTYDISNIWYDKERETRESLSAREKTEEQLIEEERLRQEEARLRQKEEERQKVYRDWGLIKGTTKRKSRKKSRKSRRKSKKSKTKRRNKTRRKKTRKSRK